MVWTAIGCAVLGAVFLAFGTQRQGSAVRASSGGLALTSTGFLRLLTNPRWVFGLVLLGAGMALNIIALATATLTVVQPIGAIALVITTVVNSRELGLRLNRMTVVAIGACVAGSAAFVILAVNVTRSNTTVSASEELTVVLLAACAIVIFGTPALLYRRRMGAFGYILAAGVLFGFVAVLTKIIANHLLEPNGRFLLNVPAYSIIAIAGAAALGSWCVQSAYSSGPPDLVIAGLTVIDPIVGIAVGIAVLGELRPDVEPVIAVAMGASAIVAIVGVVALSRHHPDVLQRQNERRRQ